MTKIKAYRFIPLTRGLSAIVDLEDYYWLKHWKWYAKSANKIGSKFYAARDGGKIYMHREILRAPKGKQIYEYLELKRHLAFTNLRS